MAWTRDEAGRSACCSAFSLSQPILERVPGAAAHSM